jgi:hypothetical protein
MKKGIKGKYWMMAAVVASAAGSMSAQAADWSDNSIGYRYGTKFAEPFNTQDIAKSIVNFQHASGYKYGTNFLNVDLLMSDSKDDNAQEAYRLPQYPGHRQDQRQGPVLRSGTRCGPDPGL